MSLCNAPGQAECWDSQQGVGVPHQCTNAASASDSQCHEACNESYCKSGSAFQELAAHLATVSLSGRPSGDQDISSTLGSCRHRASALGRTLQQLLASSRESSSWCHLNEATAELLGIDERIVRWRRSLYLISRPATCCWMWTASLQRSQTWACPRCWRAATPPPCWWAPGHVLPHP